MKRMLVALTLTASCLCLAACGDAPETTAGQTDAPAVITTAPAQLDTKPNTTTPPTTPPTTVPATVPATTPVIRTGWYTEGGYTYYYLPNGYMTTGWMELEGNKHYFDENGRMITGWFDQDGQRYFFDGKGILYKGLLQLAEKTFYLDEKGRMVTGWVEIAGRQYCFGADGVALSGWQTDESGVLRYLDRDGGTANGWMDVDGQRYYFDADGTKHTGWLDADNKRYYLDENGQIVTGWLLQDGKRYYLQENGVMSRGCVEIDGVKTYFTSSGDYILLVNPWNYLPEDYAPKLVSLNRYNGYNDMLIAEECYDALVKMLSDCRSQCQIAYVVSSYRTQAFQEKNYERKVNYYLNLGYGRAEAEVLAAKVVAVPGTSEHQSGLAVDIVDNKLWALEEEQADMPAQKWLMAHCWEYGFILRYPKDKTDVTGIIYEPWHYRYVGVEVATELYELGLTLEEYLDMLTEQAK